MPELTLRQYLAAHAPECPEWYVCKTFTEQISGNLKPDIPPLLPDILIEDCKSWFRDPTYDLISGEKWVGWEATGTIYALACERWWRIRREAAYLDKMYRMSKWAWFYADSVMAAEQIKNKE